MASIEKFVTNRGNPGLIVDGFKFRKDNILKNSKLWRCVEKTCSSRCKTDLADLIILDGTCHIRIKKTTNRVTCKTIRTRRCLFIINMTYLE